MPFRRNFTFALAWQTKCPAALVDKVHSVHARFLYTDKTFTAFGAAYLTAIEHGGYLDTNEWPLSIAPHWLQNHACLPELFGRRSANPLADLVYRPVYDRSDGLILAVVWNPGAPRSDSSQVSPYAALTAEQSAGPPLSATFFGTPGGVPLAAHTAVPALPGWRTHSTAPSGEYLD